MTVVSDISAVFIIIITINSIMLTGVQLHRYGVSRRLFEDFLRPLLLVGLFAPAEELSAAVMIGTLYFYGKGFTSALTSAIIHSFIFIKDAC